MIDSLHAMYNVTINPLNELEALNVTILHHSDDCKFAMLQSLLEDKVTLMLQTHHLAIPNLLNTVSSSLVLSSLLSGSVAIPPSGGVHSTDLPFPQDIFAMTTLYKPINGLGGGIRHIFDVNSSNDTDYEV